MSLPIIEELQEDNYPDWTEHSISICRSTKRPAKFVPWKLIIKVKSLVDGVAKIDDLGKCSFHQTTRTYSDSPCQKVIRQEATYEMVKLVVCIIDFNFLMIF